MTDPRCAMDFCGAFRVVFMLTDCIFLSLTFSWKDRSSMYLYDLDLCGIIATGDNLRFFG